MISADSEEDEAALSSFSVVWSRWYGAEELGLFDPETGEFPDGTLIAIAWRFYLAGRGAYEIDA